MEFGIYSGKVKETLPYAETITAVCESLTFPIAFAYAIAWIESIEGEVNGKWNAANVVSDDGGHGLFQLTSSYPDDWADPVANTKWALNTFLIPDMHIWVSQYGFSDNTLIRCTAASYNAGVAGAEDGHTQGDVDLYDTDNYGARALSVYLSIINNGSP